MNIRPYTYKHVIATLHECQVNLLDDKLLLRAALAALRDANMRLAKSRATNPLVYRIADDVMGGGVSVNALITTSHLTVHTSRLHRTAEFDCATCGSSSNPVAALAAFKKALKPTYVTIQYESQDIPRQIDTIGQWHSACRGDTS